MTMTRAGSARRQAQRTRLRIKATHACAGCGHTWGPRAKDALRQFAAAIKRPISFGAPSTEALQALAEQTGRVCVLTCGSGEREVDGKCVA
jgi:hypothetical protein